MSWLDTVVDPFFGVKREVLVNPNTGERVQTFKGPNWLGWIWSPVLTCWVMTGLGITGTVMFIMSLITVGILAPFFWILAPLFINKMQYNNLIKDGWQPEDEVVLQFDPKDPAVNPTVEMRCPTCKGIVRKDASKCMHCQSPLNA